MVIPHKYYHQHDFQEDIMATITCGSCNKSHSTVNEVKLCFTQNNSFVPEASTKAPAAKVVKKAPAPVVKNYRSVEHFNTKEEAQEFVENTPNSKLKDTVNVKYVDGIQTKTYTVIVY
jgi:hypothetical protein